MLLLRVRRLVGCSSSGCKKEGGGGGGRGKGGSGRSAEAGKGGCSGGGEDDAGHGWAAPPSPLLLLVLLMLLLRLLRLLMIVEGHDYSGLAVGKCWRFGRGEIDGRRRKGQAACRDDGHTCKMATITTRPHFFELTLQALRRAQRHRGRLRGRSRPCPLAWRACFFLLTLRLEQRRERDERWPPTPHNRALR